MLRLDSSALVEPLTEQACRAGGCQCSMKSKSVRLLKEFGST